MSSAFVDTYKRIIVFQVFFAVAVAATVIVYLKLFPDELVAEATDSATVIKVNGPERHVGSTSRNLVIVELDDGTKGRIYALIGPSAVGSKVEVKVRTYESGKQNIIAAVDDI